MKHNVCYLLGLVMALTFTQSVAQPTVRFDATKTHQRITGFGGFVCSPQFQYNHMSTADIKKVWGKESTVGCNIMRLYIPIGKNAWSQSLATAKTAKQMGLIVFASPWGQPAEWKTNNSSNAKTSDGKEGHLKRANWPDYAQYLEDYVQYLRTNGVELDAISIQNEPDWAATYAGCLWTASEMAEFVKTYGPTISCKVMAPETLSVNDNYVNALNKTDVLPGFDIYGGHQYGGIQSAYKNLAKKGKEIWMTEYLINWNEAENNTRNFDFSKDFFNFFRAINVCMVGDFNAWIHYAAKRYYGMLGDGQRGAGNSGTVTKRGYIMAHFAKYVTGMTRIDIDFGTSPLEGSAYLSETGDTVVAVVANASDEAAAVTLDLPFYTQGGKIYSTTKTSNMKATTLTPDDETCRPVATIPAQSVSTVMFIKSRDRQPSNMKGSTTRFDRLDDMVATKSGFGTGYKLSGKSKTFDSSNPLISSRTNLNSGYVQLDNRYSQLVMQIKKVTSSGNLTAGATTLTYVNAKGEKSSHDYGRMDLSRAENFNLVFDLSPQTLTDGCQGLLSLTCDNAYSHLTITFGDVYLSTGTSALYAAKLSGNYVADDSYIQEYINDASCTSLDLSACAGCPSIFPWLQGTNRVVWLPESSSVGGANLIHTDLCHQLELFADGGAFRPARSFQAEDISFTTTVEGYQLLILPFNAVIPDGVKAYVIGDDLSLEQVSSIPAHTPVLIEAQGETVFTGQGEVGYLNTPLTDTFRGTYTPIVLYVGDYLLAQQDGQWGLRRIDTPTTLSPFNVYATLSSQAAFIPLTLSTGIKTITTESDASVTVFDLQGRQMSIKALKPGLYIQNGKKYIVK
ncbi:MAG: hypothetical protein J6X07_04615 [Prevotella sp.]|nr:hypothetical protein [Prevotella sp.]